MWTHIEKAVGQTLVPRLLTRFPSADPDTLFQFLAVEVYKALEKVFNRMLHIELLLSIAGKRL